MKLGFLFVWFIVWLFAAIIFATFLIYKCNFANEIPCLEEMAENYCEDNGVNFDKIYWGFRWRFSCKENSRQIDTLNFLFLEEEVEECKK